MFSCILLPLDGSERAERILTEARPLLNRADVTVHVQTVLPGTDPQTAPTAAARAYLDRIGERLQSSACAVQLHLDVGPPSTRILERAVEVRSDLILLSDRGGGGLGEWLLGSDAMKIVNLSPVAVYLHHVMEGEAAGTERAPGRSNRILLPLDGNPESEDCFPEAAMLARILGCEVDLLRVGLPLQWSLGGVIPTVGEGQREIKEYLEAAAGRLRSEGLSVETRYRQGDPATEILAQAEESRARCIAMVPRTPGNVAQILLGSVARRVLENGSTPVLMVPPKARRQKRATRIMKSPVAPT